MICKTKECECKNCQANLGFCPAEKLGRITAIVLFQGHRKMARKELKRIRAERKVG